MVLFFVCPAVHGSRALERPSHATAIRQAVNVVLRSVERRKNFGFVWMDGEIKERRTKRRVQVDARAVAQRVKISRGFWAGWGVVCLLVQL